MRPRLKYSSRYELPHFGRYEASTRLQSTCSHCQLCEWVNNGYEKGYFGYTNGLFGDMRRAGSRVHPILTRFRAGFSCGRRYTPTSTATRRASDPRAFVDAFYFYLNSDAKGPTYGLVKNGKLGKASRVYSGVQTCPQRSQYHFFCILATAFLNSCSCTLCRWNRRLETTPRITRIMMVTATGAPASLQSFLRLNAASMRNRKTTANPSSLDDQCRRRRALTLD